MPLIACPDCGAEVSDVAVACPRCARPIAAVPAAAPVPQAQPQTWIPNGGGGPTVNNLINLGSDWGCAKIGCVGLVAMVIVAMLVQAARH